MEAEELNNQEILRAHAQTFSEYWNIPKYKKEFKKVLLSCLNDSMM